MKNAQKPLIKILAIFVFLLCASSCWEEGKPESGKDISTELPEPAGIVAPEEARKNHIRYKERRIALIQRYEDSIDRNSKDYQKPRQNNEDPNGSNTDNATGERFIPAEFISFEYDS
ncbi:MAG: hypothetical protein WA913_06805, partial [Pricia sp.]